MPQAAKRIIARLPRKPSLRELEMLHDEKWFQEIQCREQQGENISDIVEVSCF